MQGIITNNVRHETTTGFYAAFLTAQGKVLHDAFVYPTIGSAWHKQQTGSGTVEEPGYLVEVDAEQAEILLKHLKRHKLRSKFNLRLLEVDEMNVWSVWKEGNRWTAHGQAQNTVNENGTISVTDCRAPGLGERLLLSGTDAVPKDVEQVPLSAYTIRRYLRGIAEGQKEMPRDDCLPMNCNIDLMGGIDFKKGCYLGQELTIRTHHTGVVRRRILPVLLYDKSGPVPERLEYDPTAAVDLSGLKGNDIRRNDQRKRSTGKFLAGVGNIGLGMCRLEQMSDLTISGEPSPYKPEDQFLVQSGNGIEVGLKAFVPDWVKNGIREPRIQRRID